MKRLLSLITLVLSTLSVYSQSVEGNRTMDSTLNSNADKNRLVFNPKAKTVQNFITEITIDNFRTTDYKITQLSIIDNFPINWIKEEDIDNLIILLNSEIECKNLKNPLSSHMWKETTKLGDYAYWLIDSYKNKQKLNIGLNFIPPMKSDKEKQELKNWWFNYKEKLK